MSGLVPDWVDGDVDLQRPSAARMYDYFLGGSHNFAVDRAAADEALRIRPDIPSVALANRAFLHRSVRALADQGIRQFLDIGSGIPTVGNVHEVARSVDPAARVVYVDVDPVAAAHSRALLAWTERVGVVQADLRDIDTVLADPETRRLIDFAEPVAVLMLAVLHFVPDADDPGAVIRRIHQVTVPGSHLVLSHGIPTRRGDEDERLHSVYNQSAMPGVMRDLAGVRRFFTGWNLVEPGLVLVSDWRPDLDGQPAQVPSDANFYGGVADRG